MGTAGTHAVVRYRCFLPDLAGFTSPRRPGHKVLVLLYQSEREGFEPSIPFQVYTRSRRAPSAARPPLQQMSRCRRGQPLAFCSDQPLFPQNDCDGERRIRTYGTVAGTPDFESGAFDHSASSPKAPFRGLLLRPAWLPYLCPKARGPKAPGADAKPRGGGPAGKRGAGPPASAENNTPAAYRIFWCYGLDELAGTGKQTKRTPVSSVLAITPHP